ncbi:MAG: sigma-E factor negative regulatory protein [Thiobacillus sp.]
MSALLKSDTLSHAREAADERLLMLSTALDGEAPRADTEACIAALKSDDVMRQRWSEYHLVGDLMRGVAPAQDDFMARFSAQLADEPTVLAPRRGVWAQRVAVASFASLAVWGVISVTGMMADAPDAASMAKAPTFATPAFQQASMGEESPYSETHLTPYLVVHQEFAPMAVVSPYQRAVAVEQR